MDEIDLLPKHWQLQKLGEVCHTTSGGTPSRQKANYYNGKIPWVKSGELDRGLILDTEEKISEEAIKNSSAKVFPKGTLLIALYGATIGKLAFLGVDASTNQAICGIFKNDKIDSNYLYHFLFYKKPNLVKQGIGGAQPNISQGILKNLDLPIPPLPEQQAIVFKIEELLSELENGKQQLLTAKQQLKVYRQSLLKWAFEGRLTSGTNNWKSLKLKDASLKIVVGYVGPVTAHIVKSGGVMFLSTTHIGENEFLNHDMREVTITFNDKNKKSQVIPGDILIARHGDSGKACIVPDTIKVAQVSNAVILRPNPEIISSKFICYRLNAERQRMQKMKVGGVLQVVNTKSMESFQLSIPSLEEQQLIVSELESKLTVCDKIEETISQSLVQAETLKQSILKKAFEGKLI
ncbi:MAG: restriction endonuclease subunit S [Bacteroidia bacterium]|nr:restriction endonuclease subunit S [Bacteroidia bacterium]MCF8427028.1 restriction endonuclease subunit S [Bacteroidia bacterium]MCF8446478.1 restriction endonuclease subunit S [Bacteroidia bacterium]